MAEPSENYVNNCSQTFENYKLNKYTDYKIAGCNDKSIDCHVHYIDDEYKRLEAEELKQLTKEHGNWSYLHISKFYTIISNGNAEMRNA